MATIAKNPLVLVDGSSYLYRAYHAFPPLTNAQGEPTGALYGVINMLKSLITQVNPTHIAVVFDAKGKTFRDELFEQYKAHRPPMPEDLKKQIAPLYTMIQALGIVLISVEGVEADDVIGTLAKTAERAGKDVLISTGDKDMAQLVSDKIMLINTMNNSLFDREGVIEKYGIPPELMIDYLALRGDASDGIPGVSGVGEKTALALLQGIGDLNTIYQNLKAIASLDFRGAKTMATKMAMQEPIARLSYQLATIKTDVPLDFSLDDLTIQSPDTHKLHALYEHYQFKRFNDDLLQHQAVKNNQKLPKAPTLSQVAPIKETQSEPPPPSLTIDRSQYECITYHEQLNLWITLLSDQEYISFDTETTSVQAIEAHLVGISFAIADGRACYIPLSHNYLGVGEQLDKSFVLEQLRPLLENPQLKKIGQNIKYDLIVLAQNGIKVQGVAFDTMLESYLLDSTGRHNMDALAQKYLGYSTLSFEQIAGKGKNQLTFDQIELTKACEYAAEDADITLRLHHHLYEKLQHHDKMPMLLTELEMPLVSVLARMEQHGVLIDKTILAEHSWHITKRLGQLESEIYASVDRVFNIASTKQLQEILFDELKLPVLKKTPKGAPSTNEEALEALAERGFAVPKLIIEHRQLSKLKSTYTDKLPQMISTRTGRIHTSYHQAAVATGRLSSSDPNLQNIPIRSEMGRRIRKAFIPRKGFKIMASDYSQVELRIMAHLSGDPSMINAFNHNQDIHRSTAAEIFGIPLDKVNSDQRRSAKAINFGLIYGMSAFGLANQLGIGRTEAQRYMERYFTRYQAVKSYMESIKVTASKQGFVETLLGRRLYLPDISASNQIRKKAAERLAINAPMQGSAADIIKRAMIAIDEKIKDCDDIFMIMQVHDELVFEVRDDRLDHYAALIKQTMEQAFSLDVPLIADIGIGDDWDEAH